MAPGSRSTHSDGTEAVGVGAVEIDGAAVVDVETVAGTESIVVAGSVSGVESTVVAGSGWVSNRRGIAVVIAGGHDHQHADQGRDGDPADHDRLRCLLASPPGGDDA